MPQARFYPLGYPVEIVSSTARVLDVADELWASWPRLFEAEPVQIEVKVHGGSASAHPMLSVCASPGPRPRANKPFKLTPQQRG